MPPTPTPLPTPTDTPIPTVVVRPAGIEVTGLSSNPEPFKRGGVFVYFNISAPASIQLRVLGPNGTVRTLDAGDFQAGKNQLFYNGLGDNKRLILPGSYTYEIVATGKAGQTGRGRSTFTKEEDSVEDVR
jgi:hypothetical protein